MNIYDVAREATVSIGTVSRVLNGGYVKQATRERVLTAIHKLDYVPNSGARSLGLGRTGVLGIMVPFFTRPFFIEVLRGVEMAAAKAGHEIVLYNVETDQQRDNYFKRLPMRKRVDGLLIVSLRPDDQEATRIREAGLPVVLVDAYHPFFTSIVVENTGGARMAVEHLISLGHRRIGFVNGMVEGAFHFNQADDRLNGYREALMAAGIDFDPTLIYVSEWNRAGGMKGGDALLRRDDPPTAIFAASDLQALGVLEAMRQHERNVPHDVSIIGFDNIELAELLNLTTIAQPMCEMGTIGVEQLLHGKDEPPRTIQVEAKLVQRQTTQRLFTGVT